MTQIFFVFDEKVLRKYLCGGSGVVLKGEFSHAAPIPCEELFGPEDKGIAFSVFLSRDIVFEDECSLEKEVLPERVDGIVKSTILENPLFESRRHDYIYCPSPQSAPGALVSIFFFETKWLRLTEDIFLSKGYIPERVGVLACAYQPEDMRAQDSPYLYAQWAGDLEVSLLRKGQLLFSRHVPGVCAKDAQKEIAYAAERLSGCFPGISGVISVFSEEESLYRMPPPKGFSSVRKISWEAMRFSGSKERITEVLSLFCQAHQEDAWLDLAGKLDLHRKVFRRKTAFFPAVCFLFFASGLAGFYFEGARLSKEREAALERLRPFLSSGARSFSLEEAFSEMEKSPQAPVSADRFSALEIYGALICCIPRGARWELESLEKKGEDYSAVFSFSGEEDAKAFLLSVSRLREFSNLQSEAYPDGRVKISFESSEKSG